MISSPFEKLVEILHFENDRLMVKFRTGQLDWVSALDAKWSVMYLYMFVDYRNRYSPGCKPYKVQLPMPILIKQNVGCPVAAVMHQSCIVSQQHLTLAVKIKPASSIDPSNIDIGESVCLLCAGEK
jgi:hypothetical protein